jgi:hypothetical protein
MKVVFVKFFVFNGKLMLSATARNEKISFSPIFGLYSDVVCLGGPNEEFDAKNSDQKSCTTVPFKK